MTINYKKLGLIIGFLIIAGAIGYFIFTFFFKPTLEQTQENINNQTTGANGLPQANQGTPNTSTTDNSQLPNGQNNAINQPTTTTSTTTQDLTTDLGVQAADTKLAGNGQMQYYNQADNKFYKLGADGKSVAMSDKQFFDVQKVTWSPTNDKAILEFPDSSKVLYNFTTKEQVTLPAHWQDFDFSPAGDKIVAKSMGVDPENRWLIVANDDGTQAKQIEALGENGADVISSWSPNNQTIAMYATGVDYNRKEVYFIGQNGENFKSMIVEGRDFQPKWSPQGDELLYSVYSADNDYKPTLWLADAQGDNIGNNRRMVGLETWADKCSYATSTIYCAVPQTLDRGAGLFPANSDSTPDYLYKINPQTGVKEQINLGTNSYTMKNLSVSSDGQYLYFTDVSTNTLRKIKLK
jgi:Tol biopolymer transport system component